jgi:hypothetical protein
MPGVRRRARGCFLKKCGTYADETQREPQPVSRRRFLGASVSAAAIPFVGKGLAGC